MSLRAKRTTLIESEGKILRLEVDPDAPLNATSASLRIFVEEAAVTLDAADIERVREALTEAAPAKGRA